MPRADDRYVEIDGARPEAAHFSARARHDGVSRSAFVDRWAGWRIDLETDRPVTLERAPIETVSLSEQGAERVFQGLELRCTVPVALEAGRPWHMRFRLAARAAAEAP